MRLVSLCPSITELLHDLGADREVVGRTRFCIHPAPWVDGIERVGGTKNPKLERIVALAPDLVFMNEEENRREDAEFLRQRGVAVHASFPRTALESAAMVRDIGGAVGRAEAGERIAMDIERRAARVAARAAELAPVSFAYLIWQEPWMAVNGDTFVSDLLTLAGGRNVFAGHADRYPVVSVEALRDAAPDVTFLSSEPFPFTPLHGAKLSEAVGWGAGRTPCVDGELLSWHGSRTPAGIDYAEQVIDAARR